MRDQTAGPSHTRTFVATKAVAGAAVGVIKSACAHHADGSICGVAGVAGCRLCGQVHMKFSARPNNAGIFMASRTVLRHKSSRVRHAIDQHGWLTADVTVFARCGFGRVTERSAGPSDARTFVAAHAISRAAEGVVKRRSADQPDRSAAEVTADARGGSRNVIEPAASPSHARTFMTEKTIATAAERVIKRRIAH